MRAGGANYFQGRKSTTSTPTKTSLYNNLIINMLQRRKNQGVEVAEKFLYYFHAAIYKRLIYKQLQTGVRK